MRRHPRFSAKASPSALLLAGALFWPGGGEVLGQAPPASGPSGADARSAKRWTTAVEPKPLSANVRKGLDWLVEHQLPGGGWGQGEESAQMRQAGGQPLKDTPDVADTSIAALALLRSGSTPTEGPYSGAIVKAVHYVRSQVEASDSTSLAVSDVKGTRVQQKLGPNIDAFLASMLLAEVKGRMPDSESSGKVDLALTKVLDKIQKHQKADGSFEGQGWAPVLAEAMCGKGINRAIQAGARVSEIALARANAGAVVAFNGAQATAVGGSGLGGKGTESAIAPAELATTGRSGAFSFASGSTARPGAVADKPDDTFRSGARGDAGVELYSRAASLGVLQDSVNTFSAQSGELREQAANAPDEKARVEAKDKLAQIEEIGKVQDAARSAVIGRLEDKRFVSGFGSNGGEEFLSYMNIAESLVVKGGDDWKKWDAKMTENLNRIQDGDGSWSGHHCITGRTFCTAAALLVLEADRTPVPAKAEGVKDASK